MSIDVMKQALEALQEAVFYLGSEYTCVEKECEDAITALRAAIEQTNDWDEVEALRASLREHMAEIHRLRAAIEQAQPDELMIWKSRAMNAERIIEKFMQPEQEPVFELGFGWLDDATKHPRGTKLYATPPQRQWQGLTQREIDELWDLHHDDYGNALSATGYEHAIEAKLRERNS